MLVSLPSLWMQYEIPNLKSHKEVQLATGVRLERYSQPSAICPSFKCSKPMSDC